MKSRLTYCKKFKISTVIYLMLVLHPVGARRAAPGGRRAHLLRGRRVAPAPRHLALRPLLPEGRALPGRALPARRTPRLLPRLAQPPRHLQPGQARVEEVSSGPHGQVQDRGSRAARRERGERRCARAAAAGAAGAGAARRAAAVGLARPPRARPA